MQLVTGGGRLDASPGCPAAIYKVMAECWSPLPEARPTFSNLLESLNTCTQVSVKTIEANKGFTIEHRGRTYGGVMSVFFCQKYLLSILSKYVHIFKVVN